MEKIDRLFAMALEGLSFSLIGAEIGCSRNAAIGKYNRIRISRGVHASKPRPKLVSSEGAPRPHKPAVAPKIPLPMLRIEAATPGSAVGVGILDVTGCRYPVADDPGLIGGVAFCNDEFDGNRMYCALHARIAFNSPPRKSGHMKHRTIPTSLLRAGGF